MKIFMNSETHVTFVLLSFHTSLLMFHELGPFMHPEKNSGIRAMKLYFMFNILPF